MSRNLLIGFGTETGNSELLAMDADRIASSHGIETRCACLDEVHVDDIKQHEYLLIICSTWGDGEQPDNAQDLYDSMQEIGDTELNGTHFAVLALGDTAFDYEDDAEEWLDIVLSKIAFADHA